MTDPIFADPSKFNEFMPEWSQGAARCFTVVKPISADGLRGNMSPKIEDAIEKHGEVRLLFYFKDFKGWEEGGALADLDVSFRYGKHVTRMAVVNPDEKTLFLFKLKQPIIAGEIRYFGETELQDAIDWVND